MLDRLNEFFKDPERENDYRDFERRFQEGDDAISDQEAARRYRELMGQVDEGDEDDEVLSEYERAFSHLSPEERRRLAERYLEASRDDGRPYDGLPSDADVERASSPRELGKLTRRAAQKDPDLLEQLVGGDSPLASRKGRMALAGLAAFAASRFLGRRR